MKRFYHLVKHAQVYCSSCGEPSPVVPFRNTGTEAERDDEIIKQLGERGWEVKQPKAYCPSCARIGS